jgi:hypothetical protein
MSDELYYSPFQYGLRKQLGPEGKVVRTLTLGRRVGVPAPYLAGAAAGAVFLAYTPLLQPGPPAKTYSPGELQFLSLGGGLIV